MFTLRNNEPGVKPLDMVGLTHRLCGLRPVVEVVLTPKHEAAIEQGREERREMRARRLAGRAVHDAITAMSDRHRPITANHGDMLAVIAVNAYIDTLAGVE